MTRELLIPQSEGALLARIQRQARVLETAYEGDAVRLIAVLPGRLAESCRRSSVWGPGRKSREPCNSSQTKFPRPGN